MSSTIYDHSILSKAIIFATKKHQGTIRKGSSKCPMPYILHPMEAATIAATMTNDANVIAAALLHDVVEDTDVEIETIKKEFNEEIATLVADQSENKRESLPDKDTWQIRKEETLESLKTASRHSKMVTLSDKLSNMRSIKRDYLKVGADLWNRFNQKDPNIQAWYYKSIKDLLVELKDYEAYKEYAALVDDVFK